MHYVFNGIPEHIHFIFNLGFILEAEPPLKRIKPHESSSEVQEIQIEGFPRTAPVKSEFLETGPPIPSKLSKWNQCTYQCAVCKRRSNSRNTITTHIIDDHGISFKEYKDKYPDLEVRFP